MCCSFRPLVVSWRRTVQDQSVARDGTILLGPDTGDGTRIGGLHSNPRAMPKSLEDAV